MNNVITETMGRMKLLEMQLSFFNEVEIMNKSLANRIAALACEVEDVLSSIEGTDLSREEGYEVYTRLKNKLNARNKLFEFAGFYRTITKHVDCGVMYKAFKEIYEELWPEEKNDHPIKDWVKDLPVRKMKSDKVKRPGKEAEPAESVS